MKFTTFAIVATFFALVFATDNVDDAVQVDTQTNGCKGQWCFNIYNGKSKTCCRGSKCNTSGPGLIYYCT